jgi:hypothetical protein
MKLPNLPWARLLGEGGLIIVSVYLAIVLEGMSQEREDISAAHTALAQMLGEMRQDLSDLAEIREEQATRDRQYEALDRWLASPQSMPLDLLAETTDAIFYSNRTLYPRRAAWTTMVAAGQLGELDAPDLVARLGDFYESFIPRVIDNGDDYDGSLNDIGRNSAPRIWDGLNKQMLTDDTSEITVFRNQLRYMHISWNLWYIDLLDTYQDRLDSLILEVEAYLAENDFKVGD